MNHPVTFQQVIARLEEIELAYGVLPLQNGAQIVITPHGGRVFGPFLAGTGESALWLTSTFTDTEAFRGFLAGGNSNIGGERVWIAPEVQYNVRDRARYNESYVIPPQVDPGHYTLDQPRPDRWRLAQEMALQAYNVASGGKTLHLESVIRAVDDPLRYVRDYPRLLDGVTFAGYERRITLSERTHDAIMSEVWNLIQLHPGGEILLPASSHAEWTDYYAQSAAAYQTVHPDHIRVRLTGDYRFKVGYKAAHLFGRAGYFYPLGEGRARLLVRAFFNNPSSPYVDEAPHKPGSWGDSLHVYNDGGEYGGFGELEIQGQAIGGQTGSSSSTDQFILWLYAGPLAKIEVIVQHLLGIQPAPIPD